MSQLDRKSIFVIGWTDMDSLGSVFLEQGDSKGPQLRRTQKRFETQSLFLYTGFNMHYHLKLF